MIVTPEDSCKRMNTAYNCPPSTKINNVRSNDDNLLQLNFIYFNNYFFPSPTAGSVSKDESVASETVVVPSGDIEPSKPGGDTKPSKPDGDTEPSKPCGDTEPSKPCGDTEPSTPGGDTEPSKLETITGVDENLQNLEQGRVEDWKKGAGDVGGDQGGGDVGGGGGGGRSGSQSPVSKHEDIGTVVSLAKPPNWWT